MFQKIIRLEINVKIDIFSREKKTMKNIKSLESQKERRKRLRQNNSLKKSWLKTSKIW